MGILADIYSGGNTLKRRLNALMADPAGTIGQGVRNFGEDQNKLLNLFANAYPMPGNRTVLNSPEQIAQFRKELADKGAQQAMAAATVWHGSPHKFDKFDASKIGTGEGAQAYGHGLYLAESPDVAKMYRSSLSDFGLQDGQDVMGIAKLISAQGAKGEARVRKGYGALKTGTPELENAITQAKQAIDKSSSLYKVDLPDEHISKFLDWDKPLSQQAPEVQKAIGPMFGPNSAGLTGQDIYKKASSFDSMANVANVAGDGAESQLRRVFPNATDGEIAQAIARAKSTGSNQRIAANMLKQAGVPGIRYLDGGSRGAGGGTSNYVLFPGNEGLLSILERNGQPVNQLQKLLKP